MIEAGKVYIIGAGPGDPELITVRGDHILRAADVIIYAGSLVSPELLTIARPEAQVLDSRSMHLEDVVSRMIAAARAGHIVARLQSGDPSIYGAMLEQIARLKTAGVPFEIVPGVSSVFAAAARLGAELTVPEVSQTVIFTRAQGRASSLPQGAGLKELARIPATLAIFLSAALAKDVVGDLLAGGMAADTPVAVVARATWPDEEIFWSTVGTLRTDLRNRRIRRQALFLVGPALTALKEAMLPPASRLYDRSYTHMFRRGENE